jgi:hypothetical protein
MPIESYKQSAEWLVQMVRQCPKLQTVSLTGDTLRGVQLEQLRPFGPLFHVLQFYWQQTDPNHLSDQAISNLLGTCNNLRKFEYFRRHPVQGDVEEVEKHRLALTALCESCPLLEELCLDALSSVALGFVLPGLCRNCTLIHTLSFVRCKISASNLRDIARMETLKDLTLSLCDGLTDASVATLAGLELTRLYLWDDSQDDPVPDFEGLLTEACLQSFAEANISRTLESFDMIIGIDRPVDVGPIAIGIASCHNLKRLYVDWGQGNDSVFGLGSLQTIAAGCPLLADVTINVTVPGLRYIAHHCSNLKKCNIYRAVREDVYYELDATYPDVEWGFEIDWNDHDGEDVEDEEDEEDDES